MSTPKSIICEKCAYLTLGNELGDHNIAHYEWVCIFTCECGHKQEVDREGLNLGGIGLDERESK